MGLVLFFGCNNTKDRNCKKFEIPKLNKEVTSIILTEKEEQKWSKFNTLEIDSILERLENSCKEHIKFSSHKSLNFYKNDSLSFSVFISDNYFKYKGTTYKFKSK